MKNQLIIPVSKVSEANHSLKGLLTKIDPKNSTQTKYNLIEQVVKQITQEIGAKRKEPSTDDKLQKRTKEMIGKRNEL